MRNNGTDGKTAVTEEHDSETSQYGPSLDSLVENYRTILNELALLTTVSVLLFGFLLSSSGGFSNTTLEESLYSVAIVLVAMATLVFVLPVVYHHLQFPYSDFQKFQQRTHSWMMIGMPMLGGALYLSLSLAIWSLLDAWALLVAALPLAGTALRSCSGARSQTACNRSHPAPSHGVASVRMRSRSAGTVIAPKSSLARVRTETAPASMSRSPTISM